MITTVLDALSAPAGAEDTRSHAQRYHDALEEAMRRLVASGLLPDRAGQPARVWAHISLADLIVLDADSALQEEWIARVRAAVGRRPRRRLGRRRRRRRVAGGEGGGGVRVRRLHHARRHRRRSTPPSWTTWSGSAWNWPGTARSAAAPARATRATAGPATAGPGRCRPPSTAAKRWRRPSSAKPRFFYCTLGRRLTCGNVHDEGIASLRPAKVERRTGVASFGARLSLPLAAFSEAPSAPPRACGGRWGAGRSRRTATGSPPAAATGRCGSRTPPRARPGH